MKRLAMTKPRRHATLDVGFPLHANTDSETDVAQLVLTLLNDIAKVHRTSHADILQALGIATAVRLAMADAAAQPGVDFSMKLLGVEVDAGEAESGPDTATDEGLGQTRTRWGERPHRTRH